jgi:hypothetical protein
MGNGPRRKNAIAGQFAARLIEMMESPAFRVLSRAAHMVLARLEIEHARHGGRENGRLPVTYEQFQEYGLHRRTIAPAIRELRVLGFVDVTERGAAGNADLRRPTLYRITFRNAAGQPGDGTHEWRSIATLEEAEKLAEQARVAADPRAVARGKKHNPSGRKCTASVAESATENAPFPVAESATTAPT